MASLALSAFGTLIKQGDGASPENFTAIAEIRDIKGPKMVADVIDVTVHNSSSPWKKFISGLLEGGEIQLDVNFIPTDPTQSQSSGVLSDMVNRVRRNYQLYFPDSGHTTWAFSAVVVGFDMTAAPKDALMATITLRISGAPTLAG